MKTKHIIIIICSIILLVIGIYGLYTFKSVPKSSVNSTSSQDIKVSVSILDANNNQVYNGNVNLNGSLPESRSVLQALKETKVSCKTSGTGKMTYITEINNIAASDNYGWLYKVNNTTPNISAAEYILKSGDNVVWYYSSFTD